MSWLLKLLGYRGREYRGNDFSVRIEPIEREVVSVIHTRRGISLNLSAQRIGKKWGGIEVLVPQQGEAAHMSELVRDLKTAFEAMRHGYVIARKTGVDIVPEAERQAAIAELNEMGCEIEVLPDGKIRLTRRAGAPRRDIETLRKEAPRMMALIETVHGTRQRFEILAQSKEFQSIVDENAPPRS
jgi:hypothetical protein